MSIKEFPVKGTDRTDRYENDSLAEPGDYEFPGIRPEDNLKIYVSLCDNGNYDLSVKSSKGKHITRASNQSEASARRCWGRFFSNAWPEQTVITKRREQGFYP